MKTYEKIYLFLKEANTYVSGEVLAEKLSLSRTSVWKAIKTLEQQGLLIESSKQKGYRILSGDLLLPELISQKLNFPVTLTKKSISTQEDAKQNTNNPSKQPHLFLASSQIRAKGRLNRNFYASQTGGIYMSLHLKPNLPYLEMEPYTMIVASSIVKAISRLTGIETQIKWVNDIYLENKKIAGILTEAITSVETGLITDLIIGVGLNFYIKDFPEELSSKAGSLFKEEPTISRNQLIEEIWKLFFTIPAKDHIKVYKEKSLVLNKEVSFWQEDKEYRALATDITDQGHLILKLSDGHEKILGSGEVSLSSW
ncbi:bifunctional biotin--[acetyl-CoA-carboxylase] ligase/biotin operon repressor BirA [Streptococcus didelphis]|uniref:bifunctional biotin--[acetyl-CoA-carboxylase] ligase/biotin operon repressor BirA n=1 Tax=Streptococcus didelphis TaxID=102886 RepID=UPI00036631EC|nr:bifunctional biotin--[acetyl-CoA-carboxylase] ligase/biotin operon repressor BirA [Streptococcus didelphis]WMB30019.1 bifunctional biotin--[acetyl-CoA-carboxylase] ligase/biotin operon repressor BirA [Streptococcus didelphis]